MIVMRWGTHKLCTTRKIPKAKVEKSMRQEGDEINLKTIPRWETIVVQGKDQSEDEFVGGDRKYFLKKDGLMPYQSLVSIMEIGKPNPHLVPTDCSFSLNLISKVWLVPEVLMRSLEESKRGESNAPPPSQQSDSLVHVIPTQWKSSSLKLGSLTIAEEVDKIGLALFLKEVSPRLSSLATPLSS